MLSSELPLVTQCQVQQGTVHTTGVCTAALGWGSRSHAGQTGAVGFFRVQRAQDLVEGIISTIMRLTLDVNDVTQQVNDAKENKALTFKCVSRPQPKSSLLTVTVALASLSKI